MANLTRWDPFRELASMREMMDRVFDRELSAPASWSTDWNLALDVVENPDSFVVKASVPGVKPDDLEITYNDRVLTIKGEMHEDRAVEQSRYHMRERRYGKFSRSISLPGTIDADHIQANYDAGVLTLTLPKTEEAKPRRIAIQNGSKIIEG